MATSVGNVADSTGTGRARGRPAGPGPALSGHRRGRSACPGPRLPRPERGAPCPRGPLPAELSRSGRHPPPLCPARPSGGCGGSSGCAYRGAVGGRDPPRAAPPRPGAARVLLLAELPSAPLPAHTAVCCLAEGVKGRHSFALRVFRVSSGCKGRKSVEIWDRVSEKRGGSRMCGERAAVQRQGWAAKKRQVTRGQLGQGCCSCSAGSPELLEELRRTSACPPLSPAPWHQHLPAGGGRCCLPAACTRALSTSGELRWLWGRRSLL